MPLDEAGDDYGFTLRHGGVASWWFSFNPVQLTRTQKLLRVPDEGKPFDYHHRHSSQSEGPIRPGEVMLQ